MPKFNKQTALPPLAQREVLASLVFLYLHGQAYIQGADAEHDADLAERRRAHLQNLVEYGLLEGAVAERDVVPF